MANTYPHPNEVGVFPEKRSLTAWSVHAGEQTSMVNAGWVKVFEMPAEAPKEAPEGAAFTAMLFVKGPFSLKKEVTPQGEVETQPDTQPAAPEGDDDALTPES